MATVSLNVKELVQGIDTMLLKYRSTFSDAEVALLHDLRADLQKRMASGIALDPISFVKVLEVLSRVFGTLDFFRIWASNARLPVLGHRALAVLDNMSQ
ncbi:MAG: hypothetical protein ACKVU0_07375 [Saprospiraceae bacterium]